MLKVRFIEHCRLSTMTSELSWHVHVDKTDHSVSFESIKILAIKSRWFECRVKEAIHIGVGAPSMDQDGGRFNLSDVWNNIEDMRQGAQVSGLSVIT